MMIKITKIEFLSSFKILCEFNNKERRILDLKNSLDSNHKLVKNILDTQIFKMAKIGEFGEIYWDNAGEIKELDGKITKCEYDISPEFAYYHSVAC
jgi:hypothetical protein